VETVALDSAMSARLSFQAADDASAQGAQSDAYGREPEPEDAEPAQTIVVRNGVVGVSAPEDPEFEGLDLAASIPDDSGSSGESVGALGSGSEESGPWDENPSVAVEHEETKRPSTIDAPDSQDGPRRRFGAGLWAKAAGRPAVVLPLLLVPAVICAALAVWFHAEVHALRDEGPGANQALVDTADTSAVNGQITDAVQKVFSYDFANTAKTEDAAKSVLVGPAIQQYNQLFTTVKQQAPQQKLVVTTTVKSSGVMRLQGDRAQVLLFVDQNAVRTDTGQNNVGPAQISVDAVRQGGQWKIEQITQR
jgi:Mce-associated membrane protein